MTATAEQNMALIMALEAEIPLFQKQLDDAYAKVKDQTKPISAGEDNPIRGDAISRLNPKFNLKGFCEAFQEQETFKKMKAQLATLKANMNADELYKITETVLKYHEDLKGHLRTEKVFDKTRTAKEIVIFSPLLVNTTPAEITKEMMDEVRVVYDSDVNGATNTPFSRAAAAAGCIAFFDPKINKQNNTVPNAARDAAFEAATVPPQNQIAAAAIAALAVITGNANNAAMAAGQAAASPVAANMNAQIDAGITAATAIPPPVAGRIQSLAAAIAERNKLIAIIKRAFGFPVTAPDQIVTLRAKFISATPISIRPIEYKAYAAIIKTALDTCYQTLVEKSKSSSDIAIKAKIDLLLNNKTIAGINGLRKIASELQKDPKANIFSWMVGEIDKFYTLNYNLFKRSATQKTLSGSVSAIGTNEPMKYVYNQLPIIGYAGTVPLAEATATRANAGMNGGVVTAGAPAAVVAANRDVSLPVAYDAVPAATNPVVESFYGTEFAAESTDAGKSKAAESTNAGKSKAAESTNAGKSKAAKNVKNTQTSAPGALSTEDIDTLVKLDGQEGTDVWFYGVRPIKLPPGDLPKDWKERPTYRKIADQLNLINYAKQAGEADTWIETIFNEINLGCTSDPKIMFSTKCPTFRTYLEKGSEMALNMGAFQFATPTADSYGSVAFTVTVKFNALTSALEDNAAILASPAELQPIQRSMKAIQRRLKDLLAAPSPVPSPAPSLASIKTTMTTIQKRLDALNKI